MRPAQPRKHGEEEGRDEEHHAGVEGRCGFEADLGIDLPERGSEAFFRLLAEQLHDGVELLGLFIAPGVGKAGVAESVGVDGAGLEGVEEDFAGLAPGGVVLVGIGGRDG